MAYCPNCNAELKTGIFSETTLLSKKQTAIINMYENLDVINYCTLCGKKLIDTHKHKFKHALNAVKTKIQELIHAVPVVSTQCPKDWQYKVVDMVTVQSPTTTGISTEIAPPSTDLFIDQSNRSNRKLKENEQLCFAQLRKQALELGANAVIATDINYSEIGIDKGILLISMSGTAVCLENIDILTEHRKAELQELLTIVENYRTLMEIETLPDA